MTVTKAELVRRISKSIGSAGINQPECLQVLNAFLAAVKDALVESERVELRGFCSFEMKPRKARWGRNPKTGEAVRIPARMVPVFRPSKLFNKQVAEARAAREAGADED